MHCRRRPGKNISVPIGALTNEKSDREREMSTYCIHMHHTDRKKKIINNFQTSYRNIKIYSRVQCSPYKISEKTLPIIIAIDRLCPSANHIDGCMIETVTSIATCFECVWVRIKIALVFARIHMFTCTVGVADCAITDFAITVYLLLREGNIHTRKSTKT